MSGSGLLRKAAQPLRKTLERHRWGLLALVLTALSFYFLHLLAFAHTGPPNPLSELRIAARKSYETTDTPVEVFFKPSKDSLDITFSIPVDADEFIRLSIANPVDKTAPCQQYLGAQVSHGRSGDGVEWAEYTLEVNDIGKSVLVTCSVRIAPTWETFDEKKVYITNIDSSNRSDEFLKPDLSFHFDDFKIDNEPADHFEGGIENLIKDRYRIRLLPYGKQIVAQWKDVRRSQARDAGLVLVAVLFGLAAACVLEWIRPWISSRKE